MCRITRIMMALLIPFLPQRSSTFQASGRYPVTFPVHPNLPPLFPYITPVDDSKQQYRLNTRQLKQANVEIDLKNNQRAPVRLDLTVIINKIRRIMMKYDRFLPVVRYSFNLKREYYYLWRTEAFNINQLNICSNAFLMS